MKKCSECKWCVIKAYGYSNYTVEGRDLYCILRMHPEMPFDHFYGHAKSEPKLLFAETCAGYNEGDPAEFDVDGESDTVSEEQHAVMQLSGSWDDFISEYRWEHLKPS